VDAGKDLSREVRLCPPPRPGEILSRALALAGNEFLILQNPTDKYLMPQLTEELRKYDHAPIPLVEGKAEVQKIQETLQVQGLWDAIPWSIHEGVHALNPS